MIDHETVLAVKYTIISLGSLVFGLINWSGFISALQPLSYMVTIFAGFMAIRHWYYATKKINK